VTDEADRLGVQFGACRYWQATIEETAYEAVALLSELNDRQLRTVRVQRGHHGTIEHTSAGIKPSVTTTIHLITGPAEDGNVVYTWYPGRLTAPGETVKLLEWSVELPTSKG
jgi:hypothetical protein